MEPAKEDCGPQDRHGFESADEGKSSEKKIPKHQFAPQIQRFPVSHHPMTRSDEDDVRRHRQKRNLHIVLKIHRRQSQRRRRRIPWIEPRLKVHRPSTRQPRGMLRARVQFPTNQLREPS